MLFSMGVDDRLKCEISLKVTNFFSYRVEKWKIFQELKRMETNRPLLEFSNHTDNSPTSFS